ncbi:TPR repeat domain-containing protein [Chloropicon primus]|uniref:Uncharacterized protein n=1 Tax=Chloropicon primus TaxID=1764295 RepID=A0A5B8MTH4_9CHLO|nr:hypothetical protein A3770_11p61450 [Chloropicon primus]UPR02840.1 TPR repeat domain-containing protein [Chloropicon primus]|eukprot:QDZ23627.1 hypothetical protein A3770_11p61450 [Chloropicon primus]
MDPLWLAQSKYRRRKYQECVEICTENLHRNPYDESFWYLKCRALTAIDWLDDIELDDDTLGDQLLDENAIAQMPRPGTSMNRPATGMSTAAGQLRTRTGRPVSSTGRPVSGFARPTSSALRQGTSLERALGTAGGRRMMTARPVTGSGRYVRLGTASMLEHCGDSFIDSDKIDIRKYAKKPGLARALGDYMLYVDHNPKRALELCSHSTKLTDYRDWWWKERLGKCYYQLGMFRDAEKQFLSSQKNCCTVLATLDLCKVYMKMDQPLKALEAFEKSLEKHKHSISLILGMSRCHDSVNNIEEALTLYKQVVQLEPSNVEALACLANDHFYNDQPEIALRYYRRLLQMGVNNAEIWNNVALCCFYSSQYDMTIHCFEKALALAVDEGMADVWYNVGHIAIAIGDIGLAYQAFKIAVSVDANHAESYNNLGVLELKRGSFEQARSNFQVAERIAPHLHEPKYNSALIAFDAGDYEESVEMANNSLEAFPEHEDSKDLLQQLDKILSLL